MTISNLPGDSSSLLVPVNLEAWAVDSSNQEGLSWYYSDFSQLTNFKSPMPEAFDVSSAAKPTVGVHLHWALPDALTQGSGKSAASQIDFPLAPNRWLIARFNIASGPPVSKFWVVESDYLRTSLGLTAADLSGGINSITLAEGASVAVDAGSTLSITSADGTTSANVIVAAAVNAGDTQITIQLIQLSSDLPAGSSVQLVGTSAFLDPFQPSSMQVTPGQPPTFDMHYANIGRNYTIDAWEAKTNPDDGQMFLQAVGPGSVHFAAYVPSIENVFSFIDTDLPSDNDPGTYIYTYMVVGWYSDPQTGDPLRGINTYIDGIWNSQADWQNQSPAQRFQQLLSYLKWSVNGDAGSNPPTTTLYHGLIADVQWPFTSLGSEGISGVNVAVGNTAIDALAALVQVEAQLQAKEDPANQNSWLAAGNTLAELMQAAMYDLLDDYGKPGGSVLIEQQIETNWFGKYQGGILWNVVSNVPQVAGQSAQSPQLTPDQAQALATQLAALNQAQRDLDEAVRKLQTWQSELYFLWLKIGQGESYGWYEPTTTPDFGDLLSTIESQLYPALTNQVWQQICLVNQAQANLPSGTDADAANQWANQQWHFTEPNGAAVTLAQLGLMIKAGAMPPFFHPADPVLLISGIKRARKHGEDGRYNQDGTMTCRLPGQTITGAQIQGQPAITAQAMQTAGINLTPASSYTRIPSINNLTAEAFFVDPANASLMASAVAGDANAIAQGLTDLIEQNTTNNAWSGTGPAPFALALWEQAWAPLFLEWLVKFYPTGSETNEVNQFALSDWHFDGAHYSWNGTGFDPNTATEYKGRTILTPQTPLLFKDKIQNYLKNNTNIDSTQLDDLITTVADWDILSQALTGFSMQLVTRLTQEIFPPPPTDDLSISCPPSSTATPPNITALVGEQYHSMPQVEPSTPNYFFPVRGGFIQLEQLQVVDAYGQTVVVSNANTPSEGFQPIIGQGLTPTSQPGDKVFGLVQLPPRVIQDARLDLRFLANDGSGQDIAVSTNSNAVCGWLLPNHLDGGIAVYDAEGILLGELLPLPQPDNWRPRPGDPGNNPPPAQPSDISNVALRSVITSVSAQPAAVFADLLSVIDETLWMVDPMGGRKDQFLSVLIGRPLAIVQAEVSLSLLGDPYTSQIWNDMLTPNSPYTAAPNIGDIDQIEFPVRLGSLELRDDGVIGYFLPSENYATFHAVHFPDEATSDTYIQQIVQQPLGGSAQYQGNINLQLQGSSVTLTMLLDPRGKAHAYTGILPVTSAALPANEIEDFIKQLKVTFRTGPIIADPGPPRLPQPAEDHGVWSWIQKSASGWDTELIVDANDAARLSGSQLQLREGWLQLSDLDESENPT
jgi:hypothetical protein